MDTSKKAPNYGEKTFYLPTLVFTVLILLVAVFTLDFSSQSDQSQPNVAVIETQLDQTAVQANVLGPDVVSLSRQSPFIRRNLKPLGIIIGLSAVASALLTMHRWWPIKET